MYAIICQTVLQQQMWDGSGPKKREAQPGHAAPAQGLEPVTEEESREFLAGYEERIEQMALDKWYALDNKLKRLVLNKANLAEAKEPTPYLLNQIKIANSVRVGDWIC